MLRKSSTAESSGTLFPPTRWTLVEKLANTEPALRIVAWEEFCESYWRPIHHWFKTRGLDAATAEDLAQDFFVKLHGKPLTVQSLDPAKGSLRSYLFAALRHHLADHLRSRSAARRGAGAAHLSLDEIHVSTDTDDEAMFDREWALALVERAVRLIRDEYVARGSGPLFDSVLLLLDPQPPAVRKDLRDTLGFSENRFNAAVSRFRERLATALRAEVTSTLAHADESAVNDELRHLIRLFVSAGGLSALNGGNPRE